MKVILEFRPGSGGDDAAAFTREVLGVCENYAAKAGLG